MSHMFHPHHILFIGSESVSLVCIKGRELKSPPLKTRNIKEFMDIFRTTTNREYDLWRAAIFFAHQIMSFLKMLWFIHPLFPVPKPGWRVVQWKFDEEDVFLILWSCVDYFCFHLGHWFCGSPYFDESLSSSRILVSLLMQGGISLT